MKNFALFACFLVIACLVVMSSAEDMDDTNVSPKGGRRNLNVLGTDVGRIISDVGNLGAHLIGGAGAAGQSLLKLGTGGLLG